MTKEDFTKYKGIFLLIGGSPCQSLSITRSKDRDGLDGKSKLFFEYVRALKEAEPKYFLFENVESMDDGSRDIISELLECKPILIDSKDFSAQQRKRLYWTNIPLTKSSNQCNLDNLVLKDIMQPENKIADKYYYKNKTVSNIDMSKQICATIHLNTYEMLQRVLNPEFKCQTLTCVSGGYQEKKVMVNGRVRKLTPVEYERLQTIPDNYTQGVADSKRYSLVGNGWTVNVISYILSFLFNLTV